MKKSFIMAAVGFLSGVAMIKGSIIAAVSDNLVLMLPALMFPLGAQIYMAARLSDNYKGARQLLLPSFATKSAVLFASVAALSKEYYEPFKYIGIEPSVLSDLIIS